MRIPMRLLTLDLVFTAFALGLSGCGSAEPVDDVAAEQSPFIGGTSTRERPEVVVYESNPGDYHSATVISNRHFLTAAHCIDYQPIIKGGRLWVSGNQTVKRVFSLGIALGGKDLAVGEMVESVPSSVRPATIATTMPSTGPYTGMGYGCTVRGGNDFGFKYYRTVSSLPSSMGCPGDSGGPLFRGALQDNGDLIGVFSYEKSGKDGYASPITYRQEILDLINATEFGDICYRVYAQAIGWMPAVCDGKMAGTTGQSRRIEGIQIWSNIPGVQLCYQAHTERYGWQAEVCDGELAGTVNRSLRLEGLKVRIAAGKSDQVTGLTYQAYVQRTGWQNPVTEGGLAGTQGIAQRMEAIKLSVDRPCMMIGARPLRCEDGAARARCQSCGASGTPRYACSFNPDPRSSCADPRECGGADCGRYGSPGVYPCITNIDCR